MKALVIGGGIGGFSAALCLHEQGIEVEVFEQAEGIRELGVGLNLMPHAVKGLSELGLLRRYVHTRRSACQRRTRSC
jgi:5-methylphenazine-1-carboxylate 1-monooxygenase